MLSERLEALGLTLPAAQPPVASYVPARRGGGVLHLSGHVCRADGAVVTGVVGQDIDVATARNLARSVALDLLASAAALLGSPDRVTGIVRLTAYVRGVAGFADQPAVANGASDLFVEIFGERGGHARSAIGVADLPLGAALEIEAIFEIDG